VLKTAPPGAPGAVWHVNAYQHTSSAKAGLRKAVWEVCGDVVDDAKEQGEAVILGGDLNATAYKGQRGAGDKAVDRACRTWISKHGGNAAVGTRDDNQRGRRSWQDTGGRHSVDLDHIVAFPATVPMSHRTLLRKLEPGLDHFPVSVAFETASLGMHIEMRQGTPHHRPRLQM
jgi:hypothetical protein